LGPIAELALAGGGIGLVLAVIAAA
jgi:hypothetical protein